MSSKILFSYCKRHLLPHQGRGFHKGKKTSRGGTAPQKSGSKLRGLNNCLDERPITRNLELSPPIPPCQGGMGGEYYLPALCSLLFALCLRQKEPPTLKAYEKPDAPSGLKAIHRENNIILSWSYNKRENLKGFHVFKGSRNRLATRGC